MLWSIDAAAVVPGDIQASIMLVDARPLNDAPSRTRVSQVRPAAMLDSLQHGRSAGDPLPVIVAVGVARHSAILREHLRPLPISSDLSATRYTPHAEVLQGAATAIVEVAEPCAAASAVSQCVDQGHRNFLLFVPPMAYGDDALEWAEDVFVGLAPCKAVLAVLPSAEAEVCQQIAFSCPSVEESVAVPEPAGAAVMDSVMPIIIGQDWATVFDAFLLELEANDDTCGELVPWCLGCHPDGPPAVDGVLLWGCVAANMEAVERITAALAAVTRKRPKLTIAVPTRGAAQVQWRREWAAQQPELRALCRQHEGGDVATFDEAAATRVNRAVGVKKIPLVSIVGFDAALLLFADETAARLADGGSVKSLAAKALEWIAQAAAAGKRGVVVIAARTTGEYDGVCRAVTGRLASADTVALPLFVVAPMRAGEAPAALLAFLQYRHRAAFADSVAVVGDGSRTTIPIDVIASTGMQPMPSIDMALDAVERARKRRPAAKLHDVIVVGDGGTAPALDPLAALVMASRSVSREARDLDTAAVRHGVAMLRARTVAEAREALLRKPVTQRTWAALLPVARWTAAPVLAAAGKDVLRAAKCCVVAQFDAPLDGEVGADGNSSVTVSGTFVKGTVETALTVSLGDGAVVQWRCTCPSSTQCCRHAAALWLALRDEAFGLRK
jgi:hypothetical protein